MLGGLPIHATLSYYPCSPPHPARHASVRTPPPRRRPQAAALAPAADRLRGFRIRVAWQPPTDPQHFIDGAICYDSAGAQGAGTAEYACPTGGLAGRYVSVQIYDRAE